ncbi:mannitol dehydrogenase family protein [Leifsonia sp. NPDC058292]|uniref:mannitol dehydrogenase family protein n=1 Tax=Leifsonia sp. NPDC058292 TaxID=3346428 RepID=UPI0036DD56FD
MTPPRRTVRHPVRIVHLGLGAFHRAHQAWYTQRANETATGDDAWGIAAFTGRSPEAARVLAAQDAVYTVIVRGQGGDSAETIESLSSVTDGADADRWRSAVADPQVGVLTLTVTEAGYRPPAADLAADRDALRAGEPALTAPGRLVDGLRARRTAAAGGLAVVSCDNLPDNGRVTHDAVIELAVAVDPDLAGWIETEVSFVSTMVDRITPATTAADIAVARTLTGADDAAPVVTEPFTEWVLSGAFPAGRPAWEAGGARFVDDVEPFERRKLWLLNAGHSLLAYLGLLRGRTTIAETMSDPVCVAALEKLWAEARTELPFDDSQVDAALVALRERFTNARIEHRLTQIAADGSQKLGPRILDPVRSRLAAGRAIGAGEATAIAAWILHVLSGSFRDAGAVELAERLRALDGDDGTPSHDTGTGTAALVVETLRTLAPDLADDDAVVRPIDHQLGALRATTEPHADERVAAGEPSRGAN